MLITTIWEKLKEIITHMFGTKSIETVLHVTPLISDEMQTAIDLWGDMYKGQAPWLCEGTVANPVTVRSLGIPAIIASEKARTATIEMKVEINAPMVEIEEEVETTPEVKELDKIVGTNSSVIKREKPVGTSERADYLNSQFDKVRKNIRRQLEYGIAKGGLVIKPYVVFPANTKSGIEYAEDKSKKVSTGTNVTKSNIGKTNANEKVVTTDEDILQPKIEFDYVQADGFVPLAFDGSSNVTEAAFVQRLQAKGITYTRIEYHKLEGTKCIVENRVYKSTTRNVNDLDLGQEVNLSEVAEWSSLQRHTEIDGVDRLLFAYFKMPEANTIDPYSPLGVSGFSRAVGLIEEADKQFSRMLWEFEGGEMAIDVDRLALKEKTTGNGNGDIITTRPVLQERLFRKIDLNTENTYEVFAPSLRDTSYVNGLNTILMRIEDAVDVSRGTLSDVSSEARTATELKILRQRSYCANAEIQKALEDALKDVIYIMNVYCDLYQITPDGEYSASFEWDDSILVDVEQELGKRITLMQNGLSSKLENRMWYFGETEQQAQEALLRIDKESLQAIQQNMLIQNQYGTELQNNKNTNSMQSTEAAKNNKNEQKKENTANRNENEEV